MEKYQIVKIISLIDFVLALLAILYETIAIMFLSDKKRFSTPESENGLDDSGPPKSRSRLEFNQLSQTTLNKVVNVGANYYTVSNAADDNSTKFLAYILVVCVVYGMFFFQIYMAAKLFIASKRMKSQQGLAALQKFSCWRIWSFVFLFLLIVLLLISIFTNLSSLKWSHWLLFAFLSVQILFRLLSIYYVGLCRKHVKGGLVHPAFVISHGAQPLPPQLHISQLQQQRLQQQQLEHQSRQAQQQQEQ